MDFFCLVLYVMLISSVRDSESVVQINSILKSYKTYNSLSYYKGAKDAPLEHLRIAYVL
jgi:hypothetical protein